jgi:hypothetical protein
MISLFLFCLGFFGGSGDQTQALSMLDKCFATGLHLQPPLGIFEHH